MPDPIIYSGPSVIKQMLFDRYDQMLAHVQGFTEGMTVIGDLLVNHLINIAADSAWQSQSLARQIVWIQAQMRGQLNRVGYQEVASKFVNIYDESELFGRQILQELGKLEGQLIPMRPDTVANLKSFDLTVFNDFGNHMVQATTRELVFNTIAGKSRAEVIKSLTAEMVGQVGSATLMADTSLRSFDRYVNNQLYMDAGITQFKFFGPVDQRNRPFCASHVNQVYSITQIKSMSNGDGRHSNVLTFAGGRRCRHTWQPVVDTNPGGPDDPGTTS